MSEEIWIDERQPIRVAFDTNGYKFYKGSRGVLGTPAQAFQRLIAVKNGDKVEISSVEDFQSIVTITSPEQALEFVRLFTSLDTHYLFPEVDYLEPCRAQGEPRAGEYDREYERGMNLKLPSAQAENGSFIVERNLLERSGRLFRGTESVDRRGEYTLTTSTIIDEHSPVIYPVFE